jgi:hypothetical protein
MFYISILVDGKDKFYFQAELLIHSILQSKTATNTDLIVHCTDAVDVSFLNFLSDKNIQHKIIEPYLDKTYCNKLRQLDFFTKLEAIGYNGVLLLDLDMFFVDKLSFENPNRFSGRIVGGPNPPLSVLNRIFKEANLLIPALTPTPVKEKHNTFNNHFNGGFYYIPWDDIEEVNKYWMFWAEWLFDRQHLFDNEQQCIHIDQVSMCMALSSQKIETLILPNNYNFPTQKDHVIEYDQTMPIYLLHYHHAISNEGHLTYEQTPDPKIIAAIKKANSMIGDTRGLRFYENFKNTLNTVQNSDPANTKLKDSILKALGRLKK